MRANLKHSFGPNLMLMYLYAKFLKRMIFNLILAWRAKCKALVGHIWPAGLSTNPRLWIYGLNASCWCPQKNKFQLMPTKRAKGGSLPTLAGQNSFVFGVVLFTCFLENNMLSLSLTPPRTPSLRPPKNFCLSLEKVCGRPWKLLLHAYFWNQQCRKH
jgi:hypothetical protein